MRCKKSSLRERRKRGLQALFVMEAVVTAVVKEEMVLVRMVVVVVTARST
jgi:hypothetical protein